MTAVRTKYKIIHVADHKGITHMFGLFESPKKAKEWLRAHPEYSEQVSVAVITDNGPGKPKYWKEIRLPGPF